MLTAQRESQKQTAKNSAPNAPFFQRSTIQPKLSINAPGDAYEQEADAMADKVMRMQMPAAQDTFFKPAASSIQRKCKGCEDEEKLHRKENNSAETHGSNELDSYVSSLSSSGQPLPESSRQFFEPRFGNDFSNVRIHTDSVAAKSAQSINALAYTTGNNIVFNSGQYSPGSENGNRLMAHELTHVVQQKNTTGTKINRLGANPKCSDAQAKNIHQGIYDSSAWIRSCLKKMDKVDTDKGIRKQISSALAANFGSTHGVIDNLPSIRTKIESVKGLLQTISFTCTDSKDVTCATACGYTVPGSKASTICPNTIVSEAVFQAGCILHEAFHAAFSEFTVDSYSGWHGHSSSTTGYPSADNLTKKGIDALQNADSYTSLIIDLS